MRGEQFDEVVERAREIFVQKNKEYGDSVFNENVDNWRDLHINLRRKFARLDDFEFGYPEGETDVLFEQIVDIINYSIIFGIRTLEESGELEQLTEPNDDGDEVLGYQVTCECGKVSIVPPTVIVFDCPSCSQELTISGDRISDSVVMVESLESDV